MFYARTWSRNFRKRNISVPKFLGPQYIRQRDISATAFCKVTMHKCKETFYRIHHASRHSRSGPGGGGKICDPVAYAHIVRPRQMRTRDLFTVINLHAIARQQDIARRARYCFTISVCVCLSVCLSVMLWYRV